MAAVALAGAACAGGGGEGEGDGAKVRVACGVHDSTCVARLGDREVTLAIEPRPVRAMRDLTFTVTVSGPVPMRPPYIDLNMAAMDMGPNRVELKPSGAGGWTGTGVIVRCPSGKRTWVAAIVVPMVGTVEFVFDVVY